MLPLYQEGSSNQLFSEMSNVLPLISQDSLPISVIEPSLSREGSNIAELEDLKMQMARQLSGKLSMTEKENAVAEFARVQNQKKLGQPVSNTLVSQHIR